MGLVEGNGCPTAVILLSSILLRHQIANKLGISESCDHMRELHAYLVLGTLSATPKATVGRLTENCTEALPSVV